MTVIQPSSLGGLKIRACTIHEALSRLSREEGEVILGVDIGFGRSVLRRVGDMGGVLVVR